MSEPEADSGRSVPPEAYTRAYYESCCQGYEQFGASLGAELPERLRIPMELAQVSAGMQALDIGCGRGEIVLQCALRGARVWGLDYAAEALGLARQALAAVAPAEARTRLGIQRAEAGRLPFASGCADLVFMLDVVEHLNPQELRQALDEAWRVLRPGGRLIVHTMPNLWYYRYGYPLFRFVQRLRGRRLPLDPRDRWPFRHVHVNEQDPPRLRRALQASGFRARVWLRSTASYDEPRWLIRKGMQLLASLWPLRLVFCNDIFAAAVKE